ncbi:MAG: EAL domain-containing protein, partial [Actinomycetota bacterium]
PTHPLDLVGPILDDLDAAVSQWLDDQAALGTPCPIEPRPRAGVAAGYGGGTWSDAEVALSVAIEDPDGPATVHFDLRDGRLATQRRRQRLADEVAEGLQHHRLPVDQVAVVPLDQVGRSADDTSTGTGTGTSETGAGGSGWTRLRSRPAVGPPSPTVDGRADGSVASIDLALAPGLAGRLDRHLINRAEELRSGPIGAEPVISVPVLGPLVGPRSALSSSPNGALVLEIDQAALASSDSMALSHRLTDLGLHVAIGNFDGGWEAWTLTERLPVHHVRPRADLIRRAMADDRTATELLASIGTTAAERTILVAAGPESASALAAVDRLRSLGITHLDRPGH